MIKILHAMMMSLLVSATPAVAQTLIDPANLKISSPSDCTALGAKLGGRESGGQWVIGSDVPIYGLSNSRTPIQILSGSFTKVSCYGQVDFNNEQRVFVAESDGADNRLCGWVDRSKLLSVNQTAIASGLESTGTSVLCEVPRAMSFDKFCQKLASLRPDPEKACKGVPPGLRAKGVLKGSTAADEVARFPFMSAPVGGTIRGAKSFFSVLEIQDIAAGDAGKVMALVGDGEGDMFGWIDLDAIELWPTRLGLFYDANGLGNMYQREGDLLTNWRTGAPKADITSGLDTTQLGSYVNGALPLLSYPIIRTVDTSADPQADPEDTSYHQVIFLGKTGEGSASQLIDDGLRSGKVEALQHINLMLVVDTTESMRVYLPLIQEGITRFIRDYGQKSADASNRLPDLRIAVYAYSDFMTGNALKLNDRISLAELMPPSRVGPGFDVTAALNRISAHRGLDDKVGKKEEAAFEAVAQLSASFEKSGAWFEDGPRFIIHIADHGSRPDVNLTAVAAQLTKNNTYYLPLPVVTKDDGSASASARQTFMRQAIQMLKPVFPDATPDTITKIDLLNYKDTTPEAVRGQIDLVMAEVMRAVDFFRGEVVGNDLMESSQSVQDLAASRIRLDDALIEGVGFDPKQVVVQASTAYAPFQVRGGGIDQAVPWTYTIALEPVQARYLRQNFETMCEQVGRPEQSKAFRALIVKVAETFSGDKITEESQLRSIMSDMSQLPGARKSFLSQTPTTLLQRADSTDPALIDDLRKDVCWIGYNLGNMDAKVYARPDQIVWNGESYSLKPGEEVIKREYLFKPIVGAETIYVPSFFFVLPSVVETEKVKDCGFLCN
jgi:hypothetical protein